MITKKTLRNLKREGRKLRVKWMKNYQGYCRKRKKDICVNLLMVVASVIIHEATHAVHLKWKEGRVQRTEDKERGKLTLKRAKGIVKAFCPDIYEAIRRKNGKADTCQGGKGRNGDRNISIPSSLLRTLARTGAGVTSRSRR